MTSITAGLSESERDEFLTRMTSAVIKSAKLVAYVASHNDLYYPANAMMCELSDLHTEICTPIHYHVGHNVAGYLPESDDTSIPFESFKAAMTALEDDLTSAWDFAYEVMGEIYDYDYAEYTAARDAMRTATGQDFCTYIPTNPGSAHDIPTALWVQSCSQFGCI